MAVLQLVERPGPQGYHLDVVDVPAPLPGQHRESVERDDELALPLSPDSAQLLDLAALAPAVGLRVMAVHLTDRSGRPTSDEGHELEEALLALVRDHRLDEARAILKRAMQFYVDRISLEDPQTRAVVSCTRRGLINLQGPAATQRSRFVEALLAGFRRVLGFEP